MRFANLLTIVFFIILTTTYAAAQNNVVGQDDAVEQSVIRAQNLLKKGDVEGAVQANRAHRERANRELLAIFEHFKLAQM